MEEKGLEVLNAVCHYINNGPGDTCIDDTGYSGDERPTMPKERIKENAEKLFLKTIFSDNASNFVDFITEEQKDKK